MLAAALRQLLFLLCPFLVANISTTVVLVAPAITLPLMPVLPLM
jgi:hypothetical protein